MTTIGLSYSLVKISTKCAPALHFMGALPYLLLLACPLMHVFMHGGHGDNHENGDHGSDEKKQNIQKSSPTKMINLIKENPYE